MGLKSQCMVPNLSPRYIIRYQNGIGKGTMEYTSLENGIKGSWHGPE